jgi:hypothetical protein
MFALNRKKSNKGTNMFTNTFSNIINNTNSNIVESQKTISLPVNSNIFSTVPGYFEPWIFDDTLYKEYDTVYNSLKGETLPEAETFPEVVVETLPEVVVETLPEVVVETLPEVVVETLPEVVVETLPEVVVETLPEIVVETTPETYLCDANELIVGNVEVIDNILQPLENKHALRKTRETIKINNNIKMNNIVIK